MLRWPILIFLAGMLVFAPASAAEQAQPSIVVLKSGTDVRAQTRADERRLGFSSTHRFSHALRGINCIDGSTPPLDDNGHGTHVSGTIAARNDGEGVVGVAPGTHLFAVKVLDSQGGGSLSDMICGVDWVTAHAASLGIKVANMS